MKALLILFLFFLTGCSDLSIDSGRQLSKLRPDEIERAEMKEHFSDTVGVELTPEKLNKLTGWINTTKNAKMYKTKPDYWILVKTKKDIHMYKITRNMLGELDLYIEMEQPDYFKNCFKQGKKTTSEIHVRMGC